MSWNVSPSEVSISFLVDRQSAGVAQAGFQATGSGVNLPPNFVCDGKPHTVTLVATSAGGKSEKDVAVSTTAS